LKDLNIPVGETPKEKMIYLLVVGPHSLIKSLQAYDINGFTFYSKAKNSRSQCLNSGVRVDAEDSTEQTMLIMGTLKKFGKSIMKCLYKFLYLNANGWSTHKVLRWMNTGFTIVDLRNVGHKDEPWVLVSAIAQVFYILHPKDEKNHFIVPGQQWLVGVDNIEDEEECN
jgi:hypothetical protein